MDDKDVKVGMRVKTNSLLADASAFVVPHLMVRRRPATEGVVQENFGKAGELWRILHEDATVGVYSCGEFEPVKVIPTETTSDAPRTLPEWDDDSIPRRIMFRPK